MRKPPRPRSIWLCWLGFVLLSGCDVAYTNHEGGDPGVSHGNNGNPFELIGVHSQIACYSCHTPGTFEPLFDPVDANDCVACHQSDYEGEHSGSGYHTTCSDCHTPTVWSDGTFNHTTISGGFELLGTHTSKACTVCHDATTFDPLFSPVDASDCVACHQTDYDGEHSGSGYPTGCADCHTPTVWSDGTFNHTTISGGFELLGTHTSKACTVCHDATTFDPLFSPVDASDCVACHQTDYEGEHSGSGYPTTCSDCHTPTVWSDGTFNHTTISGGFELLGTHTSKACTVCHDATTFDPLFSPVDASDCVACHQTDYDGQHTGSGYPTNCTGCHTPTVWTVAFETSCLTCHDGSPPPGTAFPAPIWSGFDKATFVGTAHDTQQDVTASCRGCHDQHGATQQAFLLATYVMSDGNQWTQGDGDYQLCWNCHNEDYVMNQVNAFEDLHDKHVNGERTPCAMCHDAHAPHDAGESLINFDIAVQNGYDIEYIDGRDGSTSFWRNATSGFCYITCHNKRHNPEDYTRQ